MKEEILKLKHLECYIVPESDYGKAEIWKIRNTYLVFEIPYLGGDPQYSRIYHASQIDQIIDEINSWT